MADDRPEERKIRGTDVVCSGPDKHPHPPTLIDLPPSRTVACPSCGQRYRRASDWNRIFAAAWPKAE